MIQDIFLKLNWPNWLFALLAIGIVGLAYLFYFRTLPPLSAGRKTFTFILRSLSLIVLFFLILEPILRLLYQHNEKPVVGVLLDNSASMKIKESYGERGDSLLFVVDHLNNLSAVDSLELKQFQFDLNTRYWRSDSFKFDVDGSNITHALNSAFDSLSGENLQALVLVSDGIYNQGANPFLPVQNSTVPIYTVLIGDSTVPKDIAIRRAQTNQVTYVNKELPIEVTFWQNGYDGQQALLTVSEGGNQLARKMVTFGKSGFEQKETLEITAKEAGDFNYTINLQTLAGEVTDRNNQHTARVQVLKSKLKVLVFSGTPNFDRQTLSYIGKQLEDYEFSFLTEQSAGKYYEKRFREAKLDSQDLFIFYGFPTPNSSTTDLKDIMAQVTQRQAPIFWMVSQHSYFQKLSTYEQLLPFELVSRLTPIENQFVKLSNGGRLHPVSKLDESEAANDLLWKELPPLEIYRQIKMRSGSQLLLTPDVPVGENNVAAIGNIPVCYAYRQNEIKHLVFNGTNFSNWHFQLQEDPSREEFFTRFMERAIRWLVNREDIHQVQIKPLQRIYNVGEPVVFSGQVYDEFYQPISDARVVVSITSDTTQQSDEMIAEGNGFYRQSFSGLPVSEFRYRVEAKRKDETIGVRTGKFTVKPFFLEFQQIPANHTLMRQLAEQTDGISYSPAQFVKRFPEAKLESRVQYTFSEYFVWNYWHWLALIILLLGTEWFFRKRWGLL